MHQHIDVVGADYTGFSLRQQCGHSAHSTSIIIMSSKIRSRPGCVEASDICVVDLPE